MSQLWGMQRDFSDELPDKDGAGGLGRGSVLAAGRGTSASPRFRLKGSFKGDIPGPPKWPKEWTLYCLYSLVWDIGILFGLFWKSR